ncbi:M56 family metallopeptidase [Flavitalea sp.]|nr:M56 family metallopeptidase [Flavitalea sp.]
MTPYILHVGIILAGCLAFYKILLQRETFFRLNRMILLLCLLLSFGLPLIPIPQQWSFRKAEVAALSNQEFLPGLVEDNQATTPDPKSAHVPATDNVDGNAAGSTDGGSNAAGFDPAQFTQWLFYLYWFGVAAFAINFFIQISTLLYRAYSRPSIKDGHFRIVELAGDSAPCSFGNNIFINPEKYDWDTYNQILLHEKIHIGQGHSLDIIIAEIVLIFQWFNPFAWLYRKELECNLEFLTDNKLLDEKGVEKSSYQVSLLKVSAPHFPLSVTTNYNQSLLKKRLVMMNAKRSNINTTWKYFFLLPLVLLFVSILNKPVVYGQTKDISKNKTKNSSEANNYRGSMDTEGAWFATVKGDKISVQFKNDDDNHNSFNSNTFPLSAFKDIATAKTFNITRDAGTMVLNGKFEGDQGMGRYKFTGDKDFGSFLAKEGVKDTDEEDLMVYFLVDVNKAYVGMLKAAGYKDLEKNELIPLAAMKIDAAYIQSIKSNGYPDISIQDLIPFKALNITGDYIQDIRKAGYTNVSASKMISFKAQGIDGKYIADVRSASKSDSKSNSSQNSASSANANKNNNNKGAKGEKGEKGDKGEKGEKGSKEMDDQNESDNNDNDESGDDSDNDANYIISYKALNIDAAFVRSIKEAGYPDISKNNIIAMKAQGITADYIKNLKSNGYPDISASNVIAMKAQNITPEFAKSFNGVGLSNISASDLIAMKALGITPQYVKGFKDAGFSQLSSSKVISMKAQNITPAIIKEYQALGFSDVSVNDVISAQATGTTPKFIASMKQKGHNLKSIDKYVQLKVAID